MTVDLNCDLAEGMPNDALIMPFISSANIACGYHAGDAQLMEKTVELCLTHKVAIGAHPGFNDKSNFGRVDMNLSENELYDRSKQFASINLCYFFLNSQSEF